MQGLLERDGKEQTSLCQRGCRLGVKETFVVLLGHLLVCLGARS